MANDTEFKKHNARGAITYTQFNMAQAIANNERSKYPKAADKIAPIAQFLLDQTQHDRLITHIRDVYLPEALRRGKAGEKKDAFEQKQVDKILRQLEQLELDTSPYLPIKSVYAKTLDVAPWAISTLKFTGTAGRDFEQLARVNSEDELKVPDPNLLAFPVLRPIADTVHELYPGAWAYATLNLSGYVQSASNFGISAYANTIVFLEDRDRLSGGAGLDEDDVFMDD